MPSHAMADSDMTPLVGPSQKQHVRNSANAHLLQEGDINRVPNQRPVGQLGRIANRHRQSDRPRHPTDMDFDIQYDHVPADLHVVDIHVGERRHLLMYSDRQLEILSRSRSWYVDGTFKVVKRPFTQLWSIHAFARVEENVKQLPLLYVLMSGKRKQDYKCIFIALKDLLKAANDVSPWKVESVVGDFESSVWRAFAAGAMEQRAAQQRRMVAKWDRGELEDKYLRLHDDNIIIKKHARKQEDKIKRMATKLIRLVNDRRKAALDGQIGESHGAGGNAMKVHDIENDERLKDMNFQIHDLEKQNSQLKEKLTLAKQQIATAGKRPTAFGFVQSRINTGIPKPPVDPRLTKNMRVTGPPGTSRKAQSPSGPRYGQSLLDESRADNKQLEDYIGQLQEQISVYEMEMESLREEFRLREAEFEEDIIKIKHQITADQRMTVSENIDIIRLQREVKEKATKLLAVQEKCGAFEDNIITIKRSHDNIMLEMERLTLKLNEEENRVLTLHTQLKAGSHHQHKMVELQEQITDSQKENHILKEANEKLVSSAFDLEREREWHQRENALKVQIAQLEATLKSDLGEKGGIIDKLSSEKDENDRLREDHRTLTLDHYQLREQYDDLKEKMHFFTKESHVDFTEMEEALVLLKQKKQRDVQPPEFLQKVDEELDKDYRKQLMETRVEHAETIQELEKMRNMLIVQHKINRDYQQEMDLSTRKLEETKKDYEMRLDEFARLLDIRAGRIKKLEAQLRDVAYGTRQIKLQPNMDEDDTVDFDETIRLEKGQNMFEIHVQKVTLSPDGLHYVGDEEASLFCTWAFFEFEMHSTPVKKGPRPEFDFTSQYVVKVDDFFLHYLQKETCTLELHQSFGQDYKTIAACQLSFREIFDKSRVFGTASLTGVEDGSTGMGYGVVEYWIRLREPMEQAFRLYKERTKALGYISANDKFDTQAMAALDETASQRPPDNVNELHIKLIRCAGINAKRENVQPSPYCVYQFFDFNDHDTAIVHSSNNPEFNNHQTYSVPMTRELDQYLKAMMLKVFVFDDTDPEEASYLGMASLPLITLAHNKAIKGTFELKRMDGAINGTIDVELRWQFSYIAPQRPTISSQAQVAAPQDPPERLALLPQEDLSAHTPVPRSRIAANFQPSGPSATSTPMKRDDEDTPDMLQETVLETTNLNLTRSILSKPSTSSQVAPHSKKRVDFHSRPGQSESDVIVNDAVSAAVHEYMPDSGSSTAELTPTPPTLSQSEAAIPVDESMPVQPTAPQPLPATEESEAVKAVLQFTVTDDCSASQESAPPMPAVGLSEEINSASSDNESISDRRGSQLASDAIPKLELKSESPRPSPRPKKPQREVIPEPKVEEMQVIVEPESEEGSTETEGMGDTLTEASTMPEEIRAPDSELEPESEPPTIESDSEGLIIEHVPKKKRQKHLNTASNIVTIVVSHITLADKTRVIRDNNVEQLFVEYKFLDYIPQELETPFSLPKPKPGVPITYNFSKTFHVDMLENYEKRQLLASMLLPDHPDQGRIKFTMVSEPAADQEADCEDIGVTYVSVPEILRTESDVHEQNYDLFSAKNESKKIGTINLTVICLDALKAIELELHPDATY